MNRDDVVRRWEGMDTPAPGRWRLDDEASEVGFVARYLRVMRMRIRFRRFRGFVHIAERPEESTLEAEIDAASIDTGVGILDRLLRSPRVLDCEIYPHIRFRSSAVEHLGGVRLRVPGELTVREATRPVELEVEYRGVGPGGRARFFAWSDIDREEFLHWRALLGIKRWRVGRRMRIELAIEASRERPSRGRG